MKLCAASQDPKKLARAIYHTLDCSNIMRDVSTWFSLLNGRSFRGIIFSTELVPSYFVACDVLTNTHSVADAQTCDYQFSSWRKVASFEDALLVMALKGRKEDLPEIKASSPSMSSVTTDLDHLSVSSLSIFNDGMSDFNDELNLRDH